MISPSPIERHVDLQRAFGSRIQSLDDAPHRRLAERLLRRAAAPVDGIDAPITIRPAATADEPAIARLGVLDGHRLPAGPHLVAEAGGRIVVAAEVRSGATVADPFQPTAGIARLVALRADQLRPRAA